MPHEHQHPALSDALTQSERTSVGMGRYFFRRLERLVDLRRGKWGELNPQEQKAVDWAIYSTLLDCLALDIAPTARDLVRRHFGAPPAQPTPSETAVEQPDPAQG